MAKALVTVKIKNGDFSKALKIFKKRVNDSGHLQEVRERQEYIKPSIQKRKNKMEAKRNNDRQLNIDRRYFGE